MPNFINNLHCKRAVPQLLWKGLFFLVLNMGNLILGQSKFYKFFMYQKVTNLETANYRKAYHPKMAVKGHNFWKVWISRDVYILCIYVPAWDQILIVTLFAFKLSLLLSPVTSNFLFTICCYTYLKSLSKKNYTHLNIVFIITLFIKA